MELSDRELAARWWDGLNNSIGNSPNTKIYWSRKYPILKMWRTLSADDIYWIWKQKAGEGI